MCLSLADALRRSELTAEADVELVRCEEDLDNVENEGWDSPSIATSRVRLAVLRNDQHSAHRLLQAMLGRSYCCQQLLRTDPILKSLEQSKAHQQSVAQIVGAVDTAWKEISAARKP